MRQYFFQQYPIPNGDRLDLIENENAVCELVELSESLFSPRKQGMEELMEG